MNNVKNILASKKTAAGLLFASAVCSTSAFASAPASPADAAFAQVSALITKFETAAWPIVISVTVATIGISLFKKFSKKAAS